MNWDQSSRNRRIGVRYTATLGVSLIFLSCGVARCTPPDIESLQQLLKARDAQFDNLVLEFEESGQKQLGGFPAWKDPEFAKKYNIDSDDVAIVQYITNEKVAVRGGETTYERKIIKSTTISGDPSWNITPFQKLSNVPPYGVDYRDSRGKDVALFTPEMPGQDSADLHRQQVEFSLGFGLGSRLNTLQKVEETKDHLLLVEGVLRPHGGMDLTFSATLDPADYICKSIKVSPTIANGISYEVVTKERFQRESFSCAGESEMTVIYNRGKPSEYKVSMKIRVLDCHTALTDAAYANFVRMPIQSGTQIQDPYNLVPELAQQHSISGGPTPSNNRTPIVLTIIAALVLAILVIRKRVLLFYSK